MKKERSLLKGLLDKFTFAEVDTTDRASNSPTQRFWGSIFGEPTTQMLMTLLTWKAYSAAVVFLAAPLAVAGPSVLAFAAGVVILLGIPVVTVGSALFYRRAGKHLRSTKVSRTGREILELAESRLRTVRATGDKDVEKAYRRTMHTIEDILDKEARTVIAQERLRRKIEGLPSNEKGAAKRERLEARSEALEVQRSDFVQQAEEHLELLLVIGRTEADAAREVGRLTEAQGRVHDLEDHVQSRSDAEIESSLREDLTTAARSRALRDTDHWGPIERISIPARRLRIGRFLRNRYLMAATSLAVGWVFYSLLKTLDFGTFAQYLFAAGFTAWIFEQSDKTSKDILTVEVTNSGREAIRIARDALERLERTGSTDLVERVRAEVTNIEDLAGRELELARKRRPFETENTSSEGFAAERRRVEREMFDLAVLLGRVADTESEVQENVPQRRVLLETAKSEVRHLREES